MKKIRLLAIIALLLVSTGCPPAIEKHTGPCTLSLRFTVKCYWFTRPNNEIFEMCMDNPPPFNVGSKFEDITYTDDNADLRHFVKAKFAK